MSRGMAVYPKCSWQAARVRAVWQSKNCILFACTDTSHVGAVRARVRIFFFLYTHTHTKLVRDIL